MPGATLRLRPLLVPALLMAVTACPPAAPDTSADLEALAALRTAFQAAENTGDADAVVQTLAADVILMAPNRPAIEGADAVGAHFEAQFEQVTLALDYRSLEAVVTGDWAFDRGTYEATVTPRMGGEASTSRGKYLWVAKRSTDGAWRYARITWNGDGGG